MVGDREAAETVDAVFAQAHRHTTDGKGAKVEMDTGNGYRDEDSELQQSPFSWAQLMAEEPVKPMGRSRKRKRASASLFERVLSLEREGGR